MTVQINYIQIIYLFANAFRVFALNLYMELFFSKRNLWCPSWVKKGTLMGYYLVNSLVYLLVHNSMVTAASNAFLFFVLTIPYKSSIWRRIFAVCSTFVLGVICEGIVGRTVMWLLDDVQSILVITYIISNFLLYLMVLGLKSLLQEKEEILFPGSHWVVLSIIPLISSIADVVLILGGYKQWVNIIVILCLFIVNITFFYLYSQLVDKCEIEVQNQALQQQNMAYFQQISVIQKSEEQIASLRHDYKNHMIAIKELIKKDQTFELLKYFETMGEIIQDKKQYVKSGNSTLDGLINYKLNIIRELGTNMELTVDVPEKLNIDSFDVVIIIGNLMDNAIRALKDQAKGSFVMKLKYDKGMLFLHTKNSYIGKLKKNGDTFLSTKKETKSLHGIGLRNVKMAVEKYNGNMKIKVENNFFDVEIVMYI